LKLGYFAMPLHPPGANFTKTIHDDLGQVVFLDKLGYHEAWIGEHFTAEWENIPAPDLFIASALARTKNIIMGTGVTCMPNHNPFVLAHRIAQLDHMAKGRFYWGVGAGGFPGDMTVFGYGEGKKDNRVMTRKAVDAVLALWADPRPGHYKNEFFEYTVPEPEPKHGLHVFLKPYQKPHPPIGVAGVTPKSSTLSLAGERGWLPLSINLVPTWVLKTHWQAVEEGATRAGRKPDRDQWRICREIFVAKTTKEARSQALQGMLKRDWDRYFYPLLARDNLLGMCKIDKVMPDSGVTAEYMLENVWIVGSPDDVAAKLTKLNQDVGGYGVLVAMAHEWEPRQAWEQSFCLLKDAVLPQL